MCCFLLVGWYPGGVHRQENRETWRRTRQIQGSDEEDERRALKGEIKYHIVMQMWIP